MHSVKRINVLNIKTLEYLYILIFLGFQNQIPGSFYVKDIDTLNTMHLAVVKKQKFIPFSLEYFQKEFLLFLSDNQIALFIAKYRGKIIAASYGIFWSGMAFYHHAALLPEYKKIPASYLLQWHAIQ